MGIDFNVNVKRKFVHNGREYNSLDEMPDDVRRIFTQSAITHPGNIDIKTETKINFNGVEYGSIEEMLPEVRSMYEKVMKAIQTGNTADLSSDMLMTKDRTHSYRKSDISMPHSKDIKIEASFSPRALIISSAVIVLILIIYFLLK